MTAQLVETREKLAAKQAQLDAIFQEAGEDLDFRKVKSLEGDTLAKVEKVRALEKECEALFDEAKAIADAQAIVAKSRARGEQIGGMVGSPVPLGNGEKGFGQMFVESATYKSRNARGIGPAVDLDLDVKTLFQTSAGWAPETLRSGRLVESPVKPLNILDLIPSGTTDQSAIVYMEETTRTNNAAERAEGGNLGEAALVLTERTSNVRSIGVWIPITKEQLEDVRYAQGYIERTLRRMIQERTQTQLLAGNGVAPNLEGLLVNATVQTQAKGTDAVPDAIYKGIVLCRVTGRAEPSGIAMHPNDWQEIRLLRTADGIYILGNPSDAGPTRLWGLPVAENTDVTENTALVGAFADFCELAIRRGVTVEITDSHASDFIALKLAIRAEYRAAFPIYRPVAFCKVTGI